MTKQSVRVAVVDDDAAVCKALARLLRVSGYAVDTYGSARDFLGSLPQAVPECLVLDLQMPEMTGLELRQHLARTGFDIPVIVITAHNGPATSEQARGCDIVAWLTKPLQEVELLAAIDAATGRSA